VRLLLAEDSERLQELLSESLKQAGYMLDVVWSPGGFDRSRAHVGCRCWNPGGSPAFSAGVQRLEGIEAKQQNRRRLWA